MFPILKLREVIQKHLKKVGVNFHLDRRRCFCNSNFTVQVIILFKSKVFCMSPWSYTAESTLSTKQKSDRDYLMAQRNLKLHFYKTQSVLVIRNFSKTSIYCRTKLRIIGHGSSLDPDLEITRRRLSGDSRYLNVLLYFSRFFTDFPEISSVGCAVKSPEAKVTIVLNESHNFCSHFFFWLWISLLAFLGDKGIFHWIWEF